MLCEFCGFWLESSCFSTLSVVDFCSVFCFGLESLLVSTLSESDCSELAIKATGLFS